MVILSFGLTLVLVIGSVGYAVLKRRRRLAIGLGALAVLVFTLPWIAFFFLMGC